MALALAKEGDLVLIRYVCRLDDEAVFCASDEDKPCQIRIGDGAEIPGLDAAVAGMSPGEQRTVVVPAEMAYGTRQSSKVMKIERDKLSDDLDVGDVLEIKLKSGRSVHVIVMDIADSIVTLDANHPLAGRDLIFDIEFLEVCEG
ncbi:MAG TPA: FKBP-type peptidyl-prolyl cis-trans isomerase [Methanotrichaceae archaeon]|nr:FKBP-type peptidyl-prolyl cis-trans isomerase [Methanotrichaceae archaeon]